MHLPPSLKELAKQINFVFIEIILSGEQSQYHFLHFVNIQQVTACGTFQVYVRCKANNFHEANQCLFFVQLFSCPISSDSQFHISANLFFYCDNWKAVLLLARNQYCG